MRRAEQEITDREEILDIIRRSTVCRLAMCDGDQPYVVPLCFGLDADRLYFHSATEGRKLDIIRRNPNVCLEFDIDAEVIPAEQSCRIGTRYRSVIGFGIARIVQDDRERRRGLRTIVRHYADAVTDFAEEVLRRTVVVCVEIRSLTGKRSG